MLVITLSGLIVEAQNTDFIYDKRQAVFKPMPATGQPSRQLPYDDLSEPVLGNDPTFSQEQPRHRVGVYTNGWRVVKCSGGAQSAARWAGPDADMVRRLVPSEGCGMVESKAGGRRLAGSKLQRGETSR